MNVLTWFGAVLRVDAARNRLVQDPVWMTTADGQDYEAADDLAPSPLGQLVRIPASRPGTVHLQSNDLYLTASAKSRDLTLDAEGGTHANAFLLIQPSDLADLRHLLGRRWRLQPSGRVLSKSEVAIGQGFVLLLGDIELDLTTCLPLPSDLRQARLRTGPYTPPPSYRLKPGDPRAQSIELANGAPMPNALGRDVELVRRDPDAAPELPLSLGAPSANAARAAAPIPFGEPAASFIAPPLVVSASDRALFARFHNSNQAHPGLAGAANYLRQENARFVCLSRGAEGLVFDRHGTSSDLGHVERAEALPAGFARQGGRLWLDHKLMDRAPQLRGSHIVFYDPRLDDIEAWIGGAIPALSLIAHEADRHARVLLPTGLGRSRGTGMLFDHREIMAVAGFSRIEADLIDAPIVGVESLTYLDRPTPGALPAAVMSDIRHRILARFDGRGERTRRIYLRPARASHGRIEMERFLLQQSFEPVQLDHMPFRDQVDLFRSAAFVVGSHGAGLANILFAPPGARVLELMDEARFQPDTWLLASKLGHLHGFLGCQGLDVDTPAFRDLYETMENFRL